MQAHCNALQPKVKAALGILGIRNFLLGIHDAAFPGFPEEDSGRGSPYSRGAAEFLAFAGSLGFNGVQLGPQGITTPANPSPYDGTFFSRNPLSLAPHTLTGEPWRLTSPDTAGPLAVPGNPGAGSVHEASARKALEIFSEQIFQQYRSSAGRKETTDLHTSFAAFRRRNARWLERDALYEILRQEYGGKNWKQWREGTNAGLDRHLFNPLPGHAAAARRRIGSLLSRHRDAVENYCLIQYLLAGQHKELRSRCRRLGLKLFGDCQIGLSGRDAWYAQSFLLRDYVMGAPPSRTNPGGQPWNYPVLDPRQYSMQNDGTGGRQGPAVRFLQERVDKLFAEYDGLRIDHPHGLVCPWVYRAGQTDPVRAVQQGARLFASPDLADHPELAEFAIPRPDQLNPRAKRYDDDWVVDLDDAQVNRYACLFDVILASAGKNSRTTHEIACEILSTQPYPIKRVMEQHGLGRFRVTQKADLDNPLDVYRSENARPEDWLMLGNHDTPPVWQQADEWVLTGASHRQAGYLAGRLRIPENERDKWVKRTAADTGALVQAKFADLFISPARHIMVFFTDLLGTRQAYNRPGTVSGENWSLRIKPDYRKDYAEKLAGDLALNIPKALATALRVKQHFSGGDYRSLISDLENFPSADQTGQ